MFSQSHSPFRDPTFGSHAAVQMKVQPALRLGGGRRVGRAAVEDRARNRAVGADRAGRADSPVWKYSPALGKKYHIVI